MDRKLIPDEVRERLREPFPPEAITQHPAKSFLSTIKAIYITERLNDIFGIGGWDLSHEIVSDTEDYVAVRGWLYLKEYDFCTPAQYGGHKKTGTNTEPADGYKSAVTDCQSKCASYLEIGIDVFKGKTTALDQKSSSQSSSKASAHDSTRGPHSLRIISSDVEKAIMGEIAKLFTKLGWDTEAQETFLSCYPELAGRQKLTLDEKRFLVARLEEEVKK